MIEPKDKPIYGRYQVIRELGAGAMATVYQVKHTQLEAVYALKVLDGVGDRMQHRLLREGRVQAKLRHPNVVSVTDVLEVDGRPGLVMEYIDGPTLAGYILANHPVEIEQIDRLAQGIIKGVRAAHRAGHLHRDLKPSNILLQSTDGELIPKIADFGLVKLLGVQAEQTQTRTGQLLGSPAYMSPEQTLSAKDLDERTDVWALGAVLYHLATGRLAFPQHDLVTVFSLVRSGDYRDPRMLRPDLPKRMWNAILGAMTVDRDVRISDCDALLEVWSGERKHRVRVRKSTETLVIEDLDTPEIVEATGAEMGWRGAVGVGVAVALLLMFSAPAILSALPSVAPDEPARDRIGEPKGSVLTDVPAIDVDSRDPPAPPEPSASPEAVAQPAPAEPVVPRPAIQPAVVQNPAPVAVPVLASVPAPGTEAAAFSVTGQAEAVWLEAAGRYFEPGPLPAGSYSVAARFPGRPLAPVEGLSVTLGPGQEVTVHCIDGFKTCRVQEIRRIHEP